jgi:RNase P/RNase MRP subunit POP5
MPVRSIHRRYVFFKVDDLFYPEDLINEFKLMYGIIDRSLSELKVVSLDKDNQIVIFRIGSKYVSKLIAAATCLSLKNNIPVILLGVSPTLRKGKYKFTLKNNSTN